MLALRQLATRGGAVRRSAISLTSDFSGAGASLGQGHGWSCSCTVCSSLPHSQTCQCGLCSKPQSHGQACKCGNCLGSGLGERRQFSSVAGLEATSHGKSCSCPSCSSAMTMTMHSPGCRCSSCSGFQGQSHGQACKCSSCSGSPLLQAQNHGQVCKCSSCLGLGGRRQFSSTTKTREASSHSSSCSCPSCSSVTTMTMHSPSCRCSRCTGSPLLRGHSRACTCGSCLSLGLGGGRHFSSFTRAPEASSHGKSCTCAACLPEMSMHSPGCRCSRCAGSPLLKAQMGHGQACKCGSCLGLGLSQGGRRQFASVRMAGTSSPEASSHDADCGCLVCSPARTMHSPSCRCGQCTGAPLLSSRSHGQACKCSSCVGLNFSLGLGLGQQRGFFKGVREFSSSSDPSYIVRAAEEGAEAMLGPFKSSEQGFDSHFRDHMECVSVGDGVCVCKLVVPKSMENNFGTLHGGATATLVDIMGTMALLTKDHLRPGVSVEMSQTYLAPALVGDTITATGRVVKTGRSLGFTEVVIEDSKGKVLATGRHTKAFPPQKK